MRRGFQDHAGRVDFMVGESLGHLSAVCSKQAGPGMAYYLVAKGVDTWYRFTLDEKVLFVVSVDEGDLEEVGDDDFVETIFGPAVVREFRVSDGTLMVDLADGRRLRAIEDEPTGMLAYTS